MRQLAVILTLQFLWAQSGLAAMGYMPGLVCAATPTTVTTPSYMANQNCFMSRASVGTYTSATGLILTAAAGVPRADYNPTTHVLNGVLLEPSKINLVPSSTTCGSPWAHNGSPTYKTTVLSPDGTSYACSVLSASGGFDGVYQTLPVSPSTVYVMSGYLQRIGTGSVTSRVGCDNTGSGGSAFLDIDASTGSVITNYGATSYSVTNVGNSWFRWSVTFTSSSAASTVAIIMYDRTAGEVAYWGEQLELGTVPTSFIPTTSSGSATRAADYFATP